MADLRLAVALGFLALAGCTARTGENGTMARLDYVELPASEVAETRRFYEQAFGWTMTAFAPTYAATTSGDTDLGLQSDPGEKPASPLPVLNVADLEAALERVKAAGGVIVKPITEFPGGRRFHFRDPSGNELAVWQPAGTDGPP